MACCPFPLMSSSWQLSSLHRRRETMDGNADVEEDVDIEGDFSIERKWVCAPCPLIASVSDWWIGLTFAGCAMLAACCCFLTFPVEIRSLVRRCLHSVSATHKCSLRYIYIACSMCVNICPIMLFVTVILVLHCIFHLVLSYTVKIISECRVLPPT